MIASGSPVEDYWPIEISKDTLDSFPIISLQDPQWTDGVEHFLDELHEGGLLKEV